MHVKHIIRYGSIEPRKFMVCPNILKNLKCRYKDVEIVCGGIMITRITQKNQNRLNGN